MLSIQLEVDKDRSRLEVRLDNSSMVEYMIDISLEVGMDRSSVALVGISNDSMKLGYMGNKLKVVSLR